MKPEIVLVDIDGTVALMGKGQPGRRGPYDWHRVGEDDPHQPVVDLVRRLAEFHPVLFVSGRDEACRTETLAWLAEHGLLDPDYDERLLMRPRKNNQPDHEVKRAIYDRDIAPNWTVKWVIDDRSAVVRMWRSLGLTVLQCADGDF